MKYVSNPSAAPPAQPHSLRPDALYAGGGFMGWWVRWIWVKEYPAQAPTSYTKKRAQ